ncbi:MAG: hypothetical protein AAFR01_07495 [Pseudomonadota bacterium]
MAADSPDGRPANGSGHNNNKDDGSGAHQSLDAQKSEMQEELHTLGNCLARMKMGTRLMARSDVSSERRTELADELTEAISEAESAFRLLSAQLK